MITVKNLIIHEIIKNENETYKAEYIPSESLLEIDQKKVEMIEELDFRYSSLSQTMAIFDPEEGNPTKQVPKNFLNYIDEQQPQYDFLAFSKDCSKNLIHHIDHVFKAKGGYLIFAEYQNRNHFIAVFVVRHRKGSTFKRDDNTKTYQVNESIYIDIEHMAMAARINLNARRLNNRYISFINKAQVDSQYFLSWFCAIDQQNNLEDTKTLHKILNQIELPSPNLDRADFINTIYNHIRNLPKGEVVNLKSLGIAFFEDENKLTDFADKNEYILNHEFNANREELRKFVNLKAKADKIGLNFPLDYLGNKIRIDNDQVIITSASLVEKIRLEENAQND
ncbi:nucleoid-associated protein [Emticicia oligotrophica]|uniref:nucleoid-associated protein n=1 Tax=Emticicia oligotrophica TaxID=312279 RepID=UPI00273B0961|nr:nucleoid-associated protein [Emticicia oligotrophica]